MQCNAMQCKAMQGNAMQGNGMGYVIERSSSRARAPRGGDDSTRLCGDSDWSSRQAELRSVRSTQVANDDHRDASKELRRGAPPPHHHSKSRLSTAATAGVAGKEVGRGAVRPSVARPDEPRAPWCVPPASVAARAHARGALRQWRLAAAGSAEEARRCVAATYSSDECAIIVRRPSSPITGHGRHGVRRLCSCTPGRAVISRPRWRRCACVPSWWGRFGVL